VALPGASRLLLDESWSGVDEVPLLGPEDLLFNDMGATISAGLDELVADVCGQVGVGGSRLRRIGVAAERLRT
jgi:hypothetical protein